MCGFWKGCPAVLSVNLALGLIGGLAKFSFSALRLPDRESTERQLQLYNSIAYLKGNSGANSKHHTPVKK